MRADRRPYAFGTLFICSQYDLRHWSEFRWPLGSLTEFSSFMTIKRNSLAARLRAGPIMLKVDIEFTTITVKCWKLINESLYILGGKNVWAWHLAAQSCSVQSSTGYLYIWDFTITSIRSWFYHPLPNQTMHFWLAIPDCINPKDPVQFMQVSAIP